MTTTSTHFFGLDINSSSVWPGQPPIPEVDALGRPMDTSLPMAVQGNPKWYYKYMRMVLDNGTGWTRTFYMPPGTSTPIMIDRINENVHEVCAWSLYVSRPENSNLQIRTFELIDPTAINLRTDSQLQRYATLRGVFCQVDQFNETDPENTTVAETWNMRQGSALMASGNHYFQIVNTGTTMQYLTTIASYNQYDIRNVLESPVVTAHRPWTVTWVSTST